MGQIKLLAKLPKDNSGNNGIDVLVGPLLKSQSGEAQWVFGWVIKSKTEIDNEAEGFATPKIRFGQIEAALDDEDKKILEDMAARYRRRRLGQPHVQEKLNFGEPEPGEPDF
jgi:hypothetical protein